ncbi:MAG: ribonuclease HI [Anaerolineales bacterium]|nr:ribonuclease HI [Anaerolineales bacterium]
MTDSTVVTIYTDGGCHPNPGAGGWAALLRFGKTEKILTGSNSHTTNNQMELTAAIEALRALNWPCRVEFYTDSEYLRRGITEWMPTWKKRQWRRKDGALANVELWKALDQVIQTHQIAWHWVKGHSGNKDNELVDRLARQAAKKAG